MALQAPVPDINATIAKVNAMSANLGKSTGGSFQRLSPLDTPPTPGTPTTPQPTAQPTVPSTPVATATSPTWNRVTAPVTPQGFNIAQGANQPQNPADLESGIRQKIIANTQAEIDAMNKIYDTEKANQEAVNTQNMGRTKALSAVMGLTGSSSADTRTANTSAVNQRSLDLIEAQRANALAGIYSKIDQQVQDQLKAAQTQNQAEIDNVMKQASQNALSYVQDLSSSLSTNGATWDEFKGAQPDYAQKLIDMAGGNEYTLRQAWNAAVPKQFQPFVYDASTQNPDGTTHIKKVEYNPRTGQSTTTIDQNTDVPWNQYAPNGQPKVWTDAKTGQEFYQSTDSSGNPVWKPITTGSSGSSSGFTLSSGQTRFDESGKQIASVAPRESTSATADPVASFRKSLASISSIKSAGTREQFIRQLQAQYPQIDPNDIAASVYKTYPDNWEKTTGGSTSSSQRQP